jgi:hypothetical protein
LRIPHRAVCHQRGCQFPDAVEALAVEGIPAKRQADLRDGAQFTADHQPGRFAHPPPPATAQLESNSNSPVCPVPLSTMKPGLVLNCMPATTNV